jgi:hypothetical protein
MVSLFSKAVLGLVVVNYAVGAETPPAGKTPPAGDEAQIAETARITQLVTDLESADYSVRSAATRALRKVGIAAVKPLANAAIEHGLEATVRALAVLEEFYQSTDDDLATAADDALELLRRSKNRSAAYRAEEVYRDNATIREKRAESRVRELGGVFLDQDGEPVYSGVPLAQGSIPSGVRVGAEWKGGDAGLRYLEHLSWLRYATIIDGPSGITDDGLTAFMRRRPELQDQRRGPALLGVRHLTSGAFECRVDRVQPGSAAEAAGIREGDTITHFDTQKVADFADLVELIKQRKPGDEIEVIVRRLGEPVKLTVVLGGWNEIISKKKTKAKRPDASTD